MAEIDTQMNMDDLVLAAGRNADALGRLYDAYYERIFRFCLHRLFTRDAAEEVTSEIFFAGCPRCRPLCGFNRA